MSSYGGPNIVTNGLILCQDAGNRLSYVSGSTSWFDLSGGGNTGTLLNGPTFNSANGGSIVFDGVDDASQINYNTIYNFQYTSTFTIECFSYVNENTNVGYLVSNRAATDGNGTFYAGWGLAQGSGTIVSVIGGLSNNNNTLDFRVVNISTANFNSLVYQKWSHLVWTNDGNLSNSRIYLNGVNATSQSYDDNTPPYIVNYNGTQNVTVGRSNADGPGHYLNGRVSIVRIYNRYLSAAEVQQNYDATKTRFGL